ncbi:MAG: ankyrin repeat domain-containing protein, partial [Planctomycetes bacterium]|nr:ankyrin repeat domain-containing protein [Planctomycetota bacterium]
KTQPLQEACQQGDLAEATRLLDKYPAFVDSAVGASPRTLLHDAAASGNVPLAELLISKGANLDARDWSKWTPLHVAAERGKADLAALLIAKGATIDAPEQGKQTPLHLAARHGTAGLVELLLKNGAEVNAEAADGRTPLHDAVWSRQKDSAKHLIDAGADLTARTETGWKGSTPLHLAVRFADREIVELLLSAGAPVDAQDENEETPLDVATKRKRKDGVVELLREATAAPRTEGQESTRDKGAGRGTVTVERSIANEQLPSTPWAEVAAIETTIHEMKALLVTDGRQHYIAELKRMRKRYKAHPSVPIILLALGEIHESSPEVAIAYYTQAIDYPLSDRLGKYREKSCHRLAAVHEAQRRYDKAIGVLQTMGGPWGPRVAALREKRRFTIWRLQLNRKDKKEEVFKEAWKTIPEILSGENRIPGEILAAYLRPLYSSEDLPRLKDDLKQAEAWIQETESTEADAHIAAEMTSVVQTIRSRLALEERINTASADAMVGLLNDPGIGNTTIRGGLFECDFHEYHWCDKLLLAAVLRHGPAILPKLIELDRNKPNSVACAAIGRLGGKEAVAYLLERASAAGEWADAEHEANYYFALLLTEDEQARAAVLRAAHSGNQKALRQIAAFGASVVLAGMMEQEGAEEDARALEPVRATNDAPLKETPITPDYAMAETLAKAMADTEPGGLFKFGERVANNGAEFLPGLVALVQKGDGWIHDEPGLRQWQYAAYLLGQIGDERCGPVLATRLTDKLATSYYLVKPLGQLRVREAVPYLVRWLKEDNEKRWEVRSSLYGAQANYMIEALEQITGEDFSPGIGPSGHVERYVKKRQEIQSAIDDWWTRAGQREYSQRVDGGKQNAASNSPRKVDASDPSVDAPSCRKRRLAVTLRPDPDRSAAYLMGEYVELYLVEDERVVQFLAPLAPAAARGPVAFTPGKDKTEVWLFEGEKIERYVVPRGPPLLPLPPTEPGQPAPDPPYTKAKSLAGSFTLTNLPKRMSFRYGGVTELTVKELTFSSGAVVSAGPLKLTLRALPP